jgi:hypothetical protein
VYKEKQSAYQLDHLFYNHTVQAIITTFKFGVDSCGFWIIQISGEILILKLRNPTEIDLLEGQLD